MSRSMQVMGVHLEDGDGMAVCGAEFARGQTAPLCETTYSAEIVDTKDGRSLLVVATNGPQTADMLVVIPARAGDGWIAFISDEFIRWLVRSGFVMLPESRWTIAVR